VKHRIIIVGPVPPPYHGVSVFTRILLESSLKEHYDIIHLNTTDKREKPNFGRMDFRNVYLGIKNLFQLLVYIIEFNPVLIYIPISQNIMGFFRDGLFIILAGIFRKKVVIHLHGGIFDRFYRKSPLPFKWFIRFAFKFVNRAIVLCSDFLDIFYPYFSSDKVVVVSNGIEDVFKGNYINREFIRKKDWNVLYLSTLSLDKGIMDLIESIPLVISRYKSVKFLIAGPWRRRNEKDIVCNFVKTRGLEKYVTFLGLVQKEEKYKLLRDGDIFVFPTRLFEGQPLAVVEAFMAGLPVISTDSGCLHSMIVNGVNGLKIPFSSPEDIANAIIYLIQHPEVSRKMSRENRKKFVETYTLEHTIHGINNVFRDVIANC